MQSTRLVPIPLDHIVAEIAAFPVASETSLALAPRSLDPMMTGDTAALWQGLEQHTLGHFPGVSVDEAVALRDKIWFDKPGAAVPIHGYLRRLAEEFLEPHGGAAIPRSPDDHVSEGRNAAARQALARRQWRWLAFAMPPDLLLAARGNEQRGPGALNLVSPPLQHQLMDRGYAETHLHLGAAVDFPLLWIATLYAIANPEVKEASFVGPGADLKGGQLIGPWLVRAVIARYILAAYLNQRGAQGRLKEFLLDTVRRRLARATLPAAFPLLVHGLAELCQGRLGRSVARFSLWQMLYGELSGVLRRPFPSDLRLVDQCDPIDSFLPLPLEGQPGAEMRLIRAGLGYLERREESGERDLLFTALFWQMIRVRCLFYRHVVQRPMTPGLQWFIRFFRRLKPARKPITEKMLLESAARLGGEHQGLRSLEIRTSPEITGKELLRTVERIASRAGLTLQGIRGVPSGRTALSNDPPLELGVVFHFTKDRKGGAGEGIPSAFWQGSHADPSGLRGKLRSPPGFRFAACYVEKRREALALAWVLRHYPLSVQVVRGLDVCTDELGVPNWVFAPLIRHVRKAAGVAVGYLRRHFGHTTPPLRTSVHAGEDFVHLQTGLRLVDEAVDQFGLGEGDRIGHGMSLGIDAREWARRAGRLPLAAEDRLFDLIWEWAWYGQGCLCATDGVLHSLEFEIGRLTRKIFGCYYPPSDIQELRCNLANDLALRAVGFPDRISSVEATLWARREKSAPSVPGGLVLLRRYLTDSGVFQRGRRLEWVDPAGDGERLARLQATLRRKIGTIGIVVEVNPTSNLLVGDLEDLTSHPMWRLRPPRPLPDDTPPVSVCVGSDDPLTFNAALPQEYQCLWDSMKLAGLSDEEARGWLDRTRACGLESRFTLRPALMYSIRRFVNTQAIMVDPIL